MTEQTFPLTCHQLILHMVMKDGFLKLNRFGHYSVLNRLFLKIYATTNCCAQLKPVQRCLENTGKPVFWFEFSVAFYLLDAFITGTLRIGTLRATQPQRSYVAASQYAASGPPRGGGGGAICPWASGCKGPHN